MEIGDTTVAAAGELPAGHRWALDQHVRDVPPEEVARQAAQLPGGPA